ncbi:MAG: N-acetylmuramoyl-L-alanine amidase [Bacteroidales bacterium]|nr:N-acetylmuramoyl-L-alanine amidase [Bacteroidales bacterium]
MKRLLTIATIVLLTGIPAFAQKNATGKVQTIVIDPGHGGDKPGALGKRSQEKDLTLSVALKFGKLISDNYPDVHIIYTRTTDKDVALADRAHLANKAKADLFVSIHANSHKTTAPVGMETFVMGLSQSKNNMEVAKKENADILLETGYKDNEDYKGFDPNSPESYVMFAMYQNANIDKSLNFANYVQKQYKKNIKTTDRGVKQAELFVLYKTTMPAVLTEIGFISNPEEEAFMMSDEGQAIIAISLFNAFATYKAGIENSKEPSKPVIDLPGYGKNKPTPAQLAAIKAAQDSIAEVDRLDNAVAAAIAISNGDTVASVSPKTPDPDEEDALLPDSPFETPSPETQLGIAYRVQFLVSEKELKPEDKALKGVTGYRVYKQDGTFRYTMGNEPTVARAKNVQSEMRSKGFKDAFIIAFQGEKRITIQEARELMGK